MRNLISRNPYSGEIKEQLSYFTEEMLEKCIERSSLAFAIQAKRTSKDKMNMIKELLPQIERQKTEISKLITFETGKPIIQSQNQVKQALKICDYYSKHSEAILSLRVKSSAKRKTLIKYMPIGTIYSILPFNHPFALSFHQALPQLLLGNCVISKHSATTPGVSVLVEKLMARSGFQSGEYQNCFVERDRSPYILGRNQIAGVSFTGSTESGSVIAALAGKYLKVSSLQLSSNDAMIVLEDADLDLAIQNIMKVGFFNSGQGGANPKRIIIMENHYEQLKTRIIEKAKKIRYGNPLQRQTQIGPLARVDLFQRLQSQIKNLPKSFKIVYQRPNIEKPFFPITIIEAESEILDEEIMGPVFILYKAKDDKEAIKLANNTKYGNTSYIFSSKRGDEISEQLHCGSIFINQLGNINSNAPRGGIKSSGYGRQGGHQGIRKFANIKTVYIN